MTTAAPQPRLTGRDVRMVVGTGVPSLASGLFLPLTLVYFLVLTEIPLPTLGLITSAALALTIPLPLVAGWLVDRWGASRVVAAALMVQAVGFAGFTVARDAWAVFAVQAVAAVGNRVYWSAIFAAIADHSDAAPGRAREWWFAAANVSRTVGITVGALVTGAVVAVGTPTAYVAVPATAAVLLVAAAVVLPHAPSGPSDSGGARGMIAALRDGPFVAYTALNAVFALAVIMLGVSLPATMREALDAEGWVTAVFLTGNALLVAVLGLPAARWVARWGRARSLTRAAVLWSGAYAVLAVAVELPLAAAVAPLALAVAAVAIAESIHAPSSMGWAAAAAPEPRRGRYLAAFQYAWLAADVGAPVLFATLFAREAWLPFALVAVANVAVVFALPVIARRLESRTVRAGEPT